MFYNRNIKNLALANMTISESVESVAQGGEGRAGSAPSKSATVKRNELRRFKTNSVHLRPIKSALRQYGALGVHR